MELGSTDQNNIGMKGTLSQEGAGRKRSMCHGRRFLTGRMTKVIRM